MATEETSVEKAPGRIRPHHLVMGLGLGIALFTATSGIVPLITCLLYTSPSPRD